MQGVSEKLGKGKTGIGGVFVCCTKIDNNLSDTLVVAAQVK